MIKVGKTTFSIESIKALTKAEFIELNKHINADLAQIWEQVNGNTESDTTTEHEAKKSSKRKRVNESSISGE